MLVTSKTIPDILTFCLITSSHFYLVKNRLKSSARPTCWRGIKHTNKARTLMIYLSKSILQKTYWFILVWQTANSIAIFINNSMCLVVNHLAKFFHVFNRKTKQTQKAQSRECIIKEKFNYLTLMLSLGNIKTHLYISVWDLFLGLFNFRLLSEQNSRYVKN